MSTQDNHKEISLEDLKKTVYENKATDGQKIQLIVFKLGQEEFALSIDQIKEVVLTPPIARVPQVPDYVRGVANIRGNIIAILDLEEKFRMRREEGDAPAAGGARAHYTLVVESSKFKAGILVKEVPNTLSVFVKDIDQAAGFIQYTSMDENCITGIVKAKDRLIILVDIFKIMESENIQNKVNNVLQ